MKHWITWRLNAMSYDNLAILQKEVRQEVHENTEKGTLAGTFCSRDKVDSIVKEISERRRFYASDVK